MSKNSFYADLDLINEKGVLVTGHGKGLVQNNEKINGKYIANDMVRLLINNNNLFGYQGYIEKEDNELTEIKYCLYFYDKLEPNQPENPKIISVDEYLKLSKHNIDIGDITSSLVFGGLNCVFNSYSEYEDILKQAKNICCIAIPFTKNEDERAVFVDKVIK